MSTGHWERTHLSEIAEVRLGRQRSPARSVGPNMRHYMRAANVTWSGIRLHDVKEMDFTPSEFEIYRLQRGDILLAEASGSASEVGKPAVWEEQLPDCCFQNTLLRVRTHPALVPFLQLHFLRDAITGAFGQAARGVGIHHLGAKALIDWGIHLPPAGEQRRIVEATESYFTRLDHAMATLERVQRNLKRYRTSVLNAAVEGRLVPTEAGLAGAEGRSYEPASVLLERILRERRRRWEEAGLARLAAKGRQANNDRWKAKYDEPSEQDGSQLSRLPEGWVWATLDQLTTLIDGGTATTATSNRTSRRVLRSSAVRQGSIDFHDHRFLPEEAAISADGFLGEGELLFTRLSGTLAYVGNCAIVPPLVGERFEFPDRLFRARVNPLVSGHYLLLCFGVPLLRRRLENAAKSTAGHQRISLSDLREFLVPLPPLAEQSRIVAETERLLSAGSSAARAADHSTIRITRLRQAILRWAFEGRLVDRDPTDEPASCLLERIRAERAAAANPEAATRKRRRTLREKVSLRSVGDQERLL